MPDERETHLFTGTGALCGASNAHRWSIVESRTTCPACRAALESRRSERREPKVPRVVPLARLRGDP